MHRDENVTAKLKVKGKPDEEQRSVEMRRRVRRGETEAETKADKKETVRHKYGWKNRERDCKIKVEVKLVPPGHSGLFPLSFTLQPLLPPGELLPPGNVTARVADTQLFQYH